MPRMGVGPTNARIMLVGDVYGESDERALEPFVGVSGQELNKMLHDAGIMRTECYCTNVVNARPPLGDVGQWVAAKKKDITTAHREFLGKWVLPPIIEGAERLQREVALINPNIIVAFGNLPLWVLTGAWGILKWRGSQLTATTGHKLIPIIHPTAILRQWELRQMAVQDLRRVAKERDTPLYMNVPQWNFSIRPSYPEVIDTLLCLIGELDGTIPSSWDRWLDFDYETRAGHIACAGISWSLTEALCIPFMCVESKEGYWSIDEEASIVHTLYRLLTHPNVKVRGQNLLYDAQYSYRHWHFVPRVVQDTMISHHTLWAGLPKRLDYQASMYCNHYVYWKDDGKTWTKDVGEDQLWQYNCVDCVRTREVGEVEAAVIIQMGLTEVEAFQQALFWPVLKAMQLGVRIDRKARDAFALELQEEMTKREQFFFQVLGHPLNPRSNPTMTKLFYNDLGIPPIWSRAKKGIPAHVTCDDDALDKIMSKEPLSRPLIRAIQEYRSLGVFLSTFVLAPLDVDGRMRCSYNICGTETYRFNSSANAFGSGTNLQNVPKGGEEDGLTLPNVRKLFVPDPGFTFFDMDLDRADLQVVVWEADDAELKAALRMGVDMHLLNAYTLAQRPLPPLEELVEGHPRYMDHRIPHKKERRLAKSFIHGCVTAGHEMLTPTGWVAVEQYQDGTPIMVWKSGELFWEVPEFFHRDIANDLVSYDGESWSQEMTWDHRVVYTIDAGDKYHVKPACAVPNSARLPKGGMFIQEADSFPTFARQVAAYQADGTIDVSGALVFHIAKGRKLGRLQELFPEATFSEWADGTFGCRVTRWKGAHLKEAGPWILEWSSEMLDAWLDELPHWDGTFGKTGRVEIMGTNKAHIEWIATVAHLRGKGASIGVKRNRPDGRKDLWYVGLNNRPKASLSSMQTSRKIVEATPVYCPKTSSGFFLFRRNGKIGVTGNTNYGGGARTMAVAAGVTVHQAEKFQRIYFTRYPGLKRWHAETETQLRTHRFVQNKFGYRRYYFDRVDGLLPEALAWIPQSSIANYIDRIWLNIHKNLPEVQVLLQVHDSLCGQVPTHRAAECIAAMKVEAAKVSIPYDDPLVIPVGIKVSDVSWGACE